jgi:hypothetical protein
MKNLFISHKSKDMYKQQDRLSIPGVSKDFLLATISTPTVCVLGCTPHAFEDKADWSEANLFPTSRIRLHSQIIQPSYRGSSRRKFYVAVGRQTLNNISRFTSLIRVVTWVPPGLKTQNSTLCPHSVFMCLAWI